MVLQGTSKAIAKGNEYEYLKSTKGFPSHKSLGVTVDCTAHTYVMYDTHIFISLGKRCSRPIVES